VLRVLLRLRLRLQRPILPLRVGNPETGYELKKNSTPEEYRRLLIDWHRRDYERMTKKWDAEKAAKAKKDADEDS